MRRRKGLRRVFVRYLLSYVLVVLVPLLFVTVFNLRFLRGNLSDYAIREAELRFQQVADAIDNEYETLFATSSQILNDLVVARLWNDPAYDDVLTAKNTLVNYVLANDFIEDIFVIDRRANQVLSARTFADFGFYFTNIYRIGEMSAVQVRATMIQVRRNSHFPFGAVTGLVESAEGAGVFLTSSSLVGSQNPNLFLGFFVSRKRLDDIVVGRAGSAASHYLLSTQDTVIYHTDPNWRATYPHAVRLLSDRRSRGTVTIDGQENFYVAERSRLTGLGYVMLLPRHVHLADLDRTILLFVISLAGCVAVATVVILLLTAYNYRPIERLVRYAGAFERRGADELRLVEQTMVRMRESNEHLAATVERSQSAVSERVVGLLLKNEARMNSDLDAFFSEYGIGPDWGYQVVVARPETTTVTIGAAPAEVAGALRKSISGNAVVFAIESVVNKYFILLVVHPPNGSPAIELDLSGFQDIARSELALIVTVGVGSVHAPYSETAKSYLEAISCLDYSIVRGPGAVIRIEEILGERHEYEYPTALLSEVRRLCGQGDTLAVSNALDRVRAEIARRNYPLYMVRMIAYDILARVQGAFLKASIRPSRRAELFSRIEALVNLGSVDAFFDSVKAVISTLEPSDDGSVLDQRLLDYISAHATDSSLSAAGVAESFGMERASFSRYFKRCTGATFVDYVSGLRVEQAKYLLVTTEMTLAEVVQRIGYSDPSAFIKKFRRYAGTTPSVYRRNRRNVTT